MHRLPKLASWRGQGILAAFDDEKTVDAILASPVPVVAVGGMACHDPSSAIPAVTTDHDAPGRDRGSCIARNTGSRGPGTRQGDRDDPRAGRRQAVGGRTRRDRGVAAVEAREAVPGDRGAFDPRGRRLRAACRGAASAHDHEPTGQGDRTTHGFCSVPCMITVFQRRFATTPPSVPMIGETRSIPADVPRNGVWRLICPWSTFITANSRCAPFRDARSRGRIERDSEVVRTGGRIQRVSWLCFTFFGCSQDERVGDLALKSDREPPAWLLPTGETLANVPLTVLSLGNESSDAPPCVNKGPDFF